MKQLLLFTALFTAFLSAQTVTDYVTVSGSPTGIAFDEEGTLYIGTESDYGIKKYTKEGVLTTLKSDMNGQPRQLSFDSSGNLWVAFQYLGSVKEVDPLSGVSISYPASSAYGISENPISKNITFSEDGKGQISTYNPKTVNISTVDYNLSTPRGMVYDNSGNLYVATTSTNEVVKITPAGVVTTFISNIPNPTYLALDNNNNLYISTDFKGQIYKYNLSETDMTADLFVDDLDYTNGLAIYDNELYCALVSKNKVVRISLDNLSISDKILEKRFYTYPNPVKDFVEVKVENNITELSLYTLEGEFVKSQKNTKRLNLSGLDKGVYILKVITNKGVLSKKLIKE